MSQLRQRITAPSGVALGYQPSADELMTDWLAERVQKGIDAVVDVARERGIDLLRMYVSGFKSPDEPTRWIVVTAFVPDGNSKQLFDYWGELAEIFYQLNLPALPDVENGDVTVQVSVLWE